MSMELAEKMDLLRAYENGNTEGTDISGLDFLRLFAELVKTGEAWTWSGFMGRIAADLIEDGFITEEGEITQEGREQFEGKGTSLDRIVCARL